MSGRDPKVASAKRGLLCALGIALATVVAFWPSLGGALVYDDLLIVARNPLITGFDRLPEVFASSYWDFLDAETASRVGYYRPLSMTLLTLVYQVAHASPLPYHVLSLALHVLASLAGWRLAVRLARDERIGFWAGLLFALHPLHVESVAWISALNDPTFCLFGFLALLAFFRWRDAGSRGAPWLAGLALLPALFGKEAALALVPVAVVLDLARPRERELPPARPLRPFVRSWFPFAAALALYYMVRVATFGDPLAGFDRTTTEFGVGLARRALLRVELLGGGLGLLAWPGELNLFRPFHPELPGGLASLAGEAAWIVAWLVGLLLAWRRNARTVLAGLLVLPAAIVPVLLRVQSLGTFPLSDRFLYLAVLGFTLALAALVVRALPRKAAVGLLSLVAVAYGARSFARTFDWRDEEVLFRTALAQNPESPNVHWGLGRVLLERYRAERDPRLLEEARGLYEDSMDLLEAASGADQTIFATKDDHLQTNLGLGWSLLYEAELDPFHDYGAPREVFERVIEYYPTSARGHVGRGMALLMSGDEATAEEELRRAIALDPRSVEAHHDLGELLLRREDWRGAEQAFLEALRYRPGDLGDMVGLVQALEAMGDANGAVQVARQARELHPGSPEPPFLLGTIALKAGAPDRALELLDRALALDPGHGRAQLRRAQVLLLLERRKEAALAYARAAELLPESFEAHYNLGVLLLEAQGAEQALPFLLRAYALREDDERGRALEATLAERWGDRIGIVWQLGSIDADAGRLELALAHAEHALELDPAHAPSRFLRALVLRSLGRPREGRADALRAAEAMPDSYTVQSEAGMLLLELDEPEAAAAYLARALALLPGERMDPALERSVEKGLRDALDAIGAGRPVGPPKPPGGAAPEDG